MDELAAALSTSFQVTTNHENNPAAQHPRFSQYKSKTTGSSQSERRRQRLESQKNKRKDYINHVRKLTEEVINDEEWLEDVEPDNEEEAMDTMSVRKKKERFYANQLMLSEWLVDVPEDLETQWMIMPCPVGKRCLVVASRGSTKSYSKGGHFLKQFPSHLPGGCRKHNGKDSTILDCIFNDVLRTFFVLDVMCWGGHPVYDSETEFRLYWLNSKVMETPSLGETSKINPFKFVALPSMLSTKQNIASMVAMPMTPEMDGLLFYHKLTHYTIGPTPLVLWLKGYMLPEILQVPVPDALMAQKPSDYTNFAGHLEIVKDDRQWTGKEKGKSKNKKVDKMETTTSSEASTEVSNTAAVVE